MTPNRTKKTNLKRWPKRFAVAALALILIFMIARWTLPTPQEQLARIDATRAVPDNQNAALIYAELLKGQVVTRHLNPSVAAVVESTTDPVSLQEYEITGRSLAELKIPDGLLDPNDEQRTLWKPWTSADYPELRQWLDTHQDRIDKLLQAAQKPSCHFPLSPTPGHMTLFDMPLGAFRQYAFILRRDANNDMAEGNVTAALAKYQSLVSMGRHFQTQPAAYHLLTGMACEAIGIHHQGEFIVAGPATDRRLDALAAQMGNLNNHWESLLQDIDHVRGTFSQTLEDHRPSRLRLRQWYRRIRYKQSDWLMKDRTSELYHRLICERRALHILIALRRHYNRTGHWPGQLEEIAPSIPPLALINPHNGGPYLYNLTDEGFQLYSIGPNARDENGRHQWRGQDDWPIWPPRGPVNKAKQPDPNDVQPDKRTTHR